MIDININTSKLAETGKDILNLVNEYKEILNTMEERINNMPSVTQEWVGVGAERFANRFSVEKQKYDELGNILLEFGKYLSDAANNIDRTIASTKI